MLHLPPTEDEPGVHDRFTVLYWNHVALEMNRVTHSLGGPQGGPTMSSRALGLLHLAMHDAYMALRTPTAKTYLPRSDLDLLLKDAQGEAVTPPPVTPEQARAALTGAAVTVLGALYGHGGSGIPATAQATLTGTLSAHVRSYSPDGLNPMDVLSVAHQFGARVGQLVLDLLAVAQGEIGADAGRYTPKSGPFYFRDEPVNPLRRRPIDPDHPERGETSVRNYHGPFYGQTVRSFAVQHPKALALAAPTRDLADVHYQEELQYVKAYGGAPGQADVERTPDQTASGYYWAYDGANLIGTPPRLYNQVLRKVALSQLDKTLDDDAQHDELVRLFALANAAMADAGKFAWLEKYRHEYWRPLTAVREHDPGCGPRYKTQTASTTLSNHADPFWLALGAPETNTHQLSFKPPFPAYPSGHATFGAACFQIARLFYAQRSGGDPLADGRWNQQDGLAFDFVSDELNGVCRDLHQAYDPSLPITEQPGTVRTRMVRHFGSLWDAIFDNAISRIYLGVHFRFDAFAPGDLETGGAKVKPEGYSHVFNPRDSGFTPGQSVGGVPLGLGIANDLFDSGLMLSEEARTRLDMLMAARRAREPQQGQSGQDGQAGSVGAQAMAMGSAEAGAPRYKSSNSHIR